MPPLVADDGWTLDDSVAGDVDRLMTWFPDADSIDIWGGPGFRFPFTRHSFVDDMHWGKLASFSLRDPSGDLAAFGQLYEKFGCINLARLVANPGTRGQGIGKRLVGMLMTVGRSMFTCARYSLFVYRDNMRAINCYEAMGFSITDYPDKMPHSDEFHYLVRPVAHREKQNAP